MQEGPDGSDELKARLAKLTSDLQAQRAAEAKEVERKAETERSGKGLGRAIGLGFRVLSEFVGAIIVGALIGRGLDMWLGTTPWLLILFLGLGSAAGFRNIYRLGAPPPRPSGKDEKPH
jgi:ATP synthase protein I